MLTLSGYSGRDYWDYWFEGMGQKTSFQESLPVDLPPMKGWYCTTRYRNGRSYNVSCYSKYGIGLIEETGEEEDAGSYCYEYVPETPYAMSPGEQGPYLNNASVCKSLGYTKSVGDMFKK